MGHWSSVGKYAAAAWLVLCAGAAVPAENAATRPDFTGLWTNGPAGPPGAAQPAGGAPRAGGAGAGAPAAPRAGGAGAGGAAAGAPAARAGGARGGGAPLPFTPLGKARRDAYTKLTQGTDDSPGNWCVGTGMPGSMMGAGGYPMEILQRPEQINVTYEAHNEVRRIFFGERNAPEADRVPSRSGYSEGRWEGDTLVVTTNNLVDQVDQSIPHTDEAVVVERWKLEGKDAQGRRIMLVEMTMTDPKFYTEPVKMTKRFAEVPNGRILPYECTAETWHNRLEEMAKKAGVPMP
jgi:hypothetical protein